MTKENLYQQSQNMTQLCLSNVCVILDQSKLDDHKNNL